MGAGYPGGGSQIGPNITYGFIGGENAAGYVANGGGTRGDADRGTAGADE
jgi:hypothetical protein